MNVEILGPGCPRCQKLERNVTKAIESLDIGPDAVSKVEDDMEIIDRGVMHTPAIAVDGEIVVEGEVPSVDRIEELLASA
ncbi:MAG: thioredoxin family protein [Halobacteriota archaeon]